MKFGVLKTSIGHLMLNILLSDLKNQKVVIFYSPSKNLNRALIKILSETYEGNIFFIESKLFASLTYRCAKSNLKILQWFKRFYENIDEAHLAPLENEKYGSKYKVWKNSIKIPHYIVPKYLEIQFNEWLKKYGISDKYICLYTRDIGFYPTDHDGVNRNSRFEDFYPLIKKLIDQGYQVVRIGRGGLKINHDFAADKFFDTNSLIECPDYVDILLFKYAQLVIGSNSGIMNISLLFDTPVLITNWFPAGIQPFFGKCKYILKKYSFNGSIVNYSAIPKNLLLCESRKELQKHGFDVVDNSQQEIYEFVMRNLDFEINDLSNKESYDFVIYGGEATIDHEWKFTSGFFHIT
jgi:putative glycosyltransferase (TIGR04372 family)